MWRFVNEGEKNSLGQPTSFADAIALVAVIGSYPQVVFREASSEADQTLGIEPR